MSTPAAFRPAVAISGSVVAFALLVERLGFPATVVLTALLASAGSRPVQWRRAILLSVAVAVGLTAVFVGLLDQPLPLVPQW